MTENTFVGLQCIRNPHNIQQFVTTKHTLGNVTSVGWQVTLCDPIWHVSSRSGVAGYTGYPYTLL